MKPETFRGELVRLCGKLASATGSREDRIIEQVLMLLAPALKAKARYFKYAYAHYSPRLDADDLEQEAILAITCVLRKRTADLDSILNYLLSIADYSIYTYLSKTAPKEMSLDDLPSDIPQLMFEWTDRADARVVLDAALQKLPVDLEQIIRFRYWDRLTQAETAKRLGLSRPRITQLEKKALEKLKITLTV